MNPLELVFRFIGGVGVILIMLGGARCDVRPAPTPAPVPAPIPEPEPTPRVIGCETACMNLRTLECPDARPTPGEDGMMGTGDDGTCEAICQNITASGTVRYPHACVTSATSCQAAERCFD